MTLIQGWTNRIKIASGHSDRGGQYRAMQVGRAMHDAGMWDSSTQDLMLHDPYNLHTQIFGIAERPVKTLELGKEYELLPATPFSSEYAWMNEPVPGTVGEIQTEPVLVKPEGVMPHGAPVPPEAHEIETQACDVEDKPASITSDDVAPYTHQVALEKELEDGSYELEQFNDFRGESAVIHHLTEYVLPSTVYQHIVFELNADGDIVNRQRADEWLEARGYKLCAEEVVIWSKKQLEDYCDCVVTGTQSGMNERDYLTVMAVGQNEIDRLNDLPAVDGLDMNACPNCFGVGMLWNMQAGVYIPCPACTVVAEDRPFSRLIETGGGIHPLVHHYADALLNAEYIHDLPLPGMSSGALEMAAALLFLRVENEDAALVGAILDSIVALPLEWRHFTDRMRKHLDRYCAIVDQGQPEYTGADDDVLLHSVPMSNEPQTEEVEAATDMLTKLPPLVPDNTPEDIGDLLVEVAKSYDILVHEERHVNEVMDAAGVPPLYEEQRLGNNHLSKRVQLLITERDQRKLELADARGILRNLVRVADMTPGIDKVNALLRVIDSAREHLLTE
jgi:hypothetical protein